MDPPLLKPIANQPGPRRPFGDGGYWFPYPRLLPQKAWLQGTRLIVKRPWQVSECDLATAARIQIRGVKPLLSGRDWVFEVLHAYRELDSAPTQLVVTGPDWSLLSGDQYRHLEEILSSRTGTDKKISKAIQRLRDLAACEELRSQPIDWSFRRGPAQ